MSLNRRDFLRSAGIGLAGITILKGCSNGTGAPAARTLGDVINVGTIGLGRQGTYVSRGFTKIKNVRIVACCDVYEMKCDRFVNDIGKLYAEKGEPFEIKKYSNHEDLIADPTIDAVIIATPDHWHASVAIMALKAGKDVYLEKPLSFTIFEGQQLVKTVRDNGRILQVGSQQRSDAGFQHAVKMVQEGKLGKITQVYAPVGAPPKPYDLPRTQIPAGLNWDKWLGPLPLYIHYNDELNPPISLDPRKDEEYWGGWRWYKETGGGYTTDWGAHMFDIAQWGIGMDGRGPIEITPKGVDGAEFLTWKYDNGVVMTEQPLPEAKESGVRFIGENGWIEVTRGKYFASAPELMFERVKSEGKYEEAPSHYQVFIDSMRSRKDPNVTVEIGHSTCTTCTLGNMATDIQCTIKWDPDKQLFVNDDELKNHRLFSYEYRKGYSLL